MEGLSEDLEFTLTPKWVFWMPPIEYKVPLAPNGHHYVPLIQNDFSCIYKTNLFRPESISEPIYQNVLKTADEVMRYPYFKYIFIRTFLFALMFYKIYQATWAFYLLNSFNIIYFLVYLAIAPFLMRLGCKQYLRSLKQFEKVLNKALEPLNRSQLKETGFMVRAGKLCLWIEFSQGHYSPPQHDESTSRLFDYSSSEVELI